MFDILDRKQKKDFYTFLRHLIKLSKEKKIKWQEEEFGVYSFIYGEIKLSVFAEIAEDNKTHYGLRVDDKTVYNQMVRFIPSKMSRMIIKLLKTNEQYEIKDFHSLRKIEVAKTMEIIRKQYLIEKLSGI